MLKGKVPEYRNGECSRCGAGNVKEQGGDHYCRRCRAVIQAEYRLRRKAKRKALVEAGNEISEQSAGDREQEKTPEGGKTL